MYNQILLNIDCHLIQNTTNIATLPACLPSVLRCHYIQLKNSIDLFKSKVYQVRPSALNYKYEKCNPI